MTTGVPSREVASGVVVRGLVQVPPSKSVSHRQLNLSLLGRRRTRVERPLAADDIDHFVGALRALGWSVESEGTDLELTPPERGPGEATLDCGNAGTLYRFLTATLTTIPGTWLLDGTSRMRERPIGALVEALRGLGARIGYERVDGYPPLRIVGGSLRGGSTELDAGESSQYLSAVLMAGLVAPHPSRIQVRELTSQPYVEITRRLVDRWGGRIEVSGDVWTVHPGLEPLPVVAVEGDYSAAPYPAAAAVLTGGEVQLLGLDPDSAQGDREFFDLLRSMEAEVEWSGDRLVVRGSGELLAVDVDMSSMPDQVPTLAAIAPFARGTTRIRNVPHLRIKESDRLAAMARELGRLGASIEERPDGLVVEGTWADGRPPDDRVRVSTWDDHRIAMSLALVGLRRPGVVIEHPEVVSKSYPDFWDDLSRLSGPD